MEHDSVPGVSASMSTPNFTVSDTTVHLVVQVKNLGVNLPPTITDIQSITKHSCCKNASEK